MFLDLTYVTEVHMGHTHALLVFGGHKGGNEDVRRIDLCTFHTGGSFWNCSFQETSRTISSLYEKQCPG